MKNLFKFKWLLLSFILSIASINTAWGYTAKFRCVPALAYGNNWAENKTLNVGLHSNSSDMTHWHEQLMKWNGLMYEKNGNLYKIYEAEVTTLNQDGARYVRFKLYNPGSSSATETPTYDSWQNASYWSGKMYVDSWDYGFSYKTWDISSGTTIVWDAGRMNWGGDGHTPQIYIYKDNYNEGQDLNKIGGSQQYYKTFGSKWGGYGGLIFRGHNNFEYGQSTNINTDVSSSTNIVLFTHCGDGAGNGSYTDGKADWQKISPAYKGTSGTTIYFDNTVTNWSNVYFKYGTPYFNRYETVTNAVPGTDGKLLYITLSQDIYYGQFMFADGYGYTNYYPIDDSNCSHYTALQADHISTAKTYIPTANAQKGATTVLDGYERTVTISSYSHGTVTVSYTDAGNTARSKTSSNFNVQQACVITVTATADDGYTLSGLTVGGGAFTSGNTYAVRANTTVAATITANTYYVRFNSNYPEGASGSGSMSNETFTYDASAKALTANAFSCVGYDFAGWNTEPDGSGDPYDNQESVQNLTITADDIVDLYAQWTPSEYTINLNYRGATGATSLSTVTATYDSGTLSGTPVPTKWGNTFGGWFTNSDGTGTEVITSAGALKSSASEYTDGSGNWTRDENNVELYAKWIPKANIYWIPGSTSSDYDAGATGAVAFTSAGSGIYYVKIDTDKDQVFHLGDGSAAAGPSSATGITLASDAKSITPTSYAFTQTGAKQTIVYVLNVNDLTLSFQNFVIGASGGKTAYGVGTSFSGSIFGVFELRMAVGALDTWSTLCLPFGPTNVQVWEDGSYYDIVPYYRSGGTFYTGHYIIRYPSASTLAIEGFVDEWSDPSSSSFKPSGNQPYIIQWHDSYFSGKYISFWGGSAGNETVIGGWSAASAPSSEGVVKICGNASLSAGSIKGAYVLTGAPGDEIWSRDEDPEASVYVDPLGCYLLAAEETTKANIVIRRRTGGSTPTGWDDVLNTEPQKRVSVYTITGFKVAQYDNCSFMEAGRRLNATYSEGIYILRSGNESVKLMIGGK